MFFTSLFDFFLPRLCFSCTQKLNPYENHVCALCLAEFSTAGKTRIDREYERKFRKAGLVEDFQSLYVFEKGKGIQTLIHSLKYGGKFRAGIFLGEKTGQLIQQNCMDWKIDLIVPVPLHKLKKLGRGYNQSFYIAKGLSRILKKPVDESILIRKKNTLSQTNMDLAEREKNIRNAFSIKNSAIAAGKNILLVDDVITTGATINECARVLKYAGANRVYAVSAAIADLSDDQEISPLSIQSLEQRLPV